MLEETQDTDIKKYIHTPRLAGTPVSCRLGLAEVESIAISKDSTLLSDN